MRGLKMRLLSCISLCWCASVFCFTYLLISGKVTTVNCGGRNNEKPSRMLNLNNSTDIKGLQDIPAPFGVRLSGIYKKSFAYKTIKDRLPVILTGIIDTMSRDKEEIIHKFGGESAEEIKTVIGELSKLRSELMTDKPLTPLPLGNNDADGDAAVWNAYLELRKHTEGPNLSWFHTVWLLAECYMYRRINQALSLTHSLQKYDPFEKQKQTAFIHSLGSIKLLANHTMGLLKSPDSVSITDKKRNFVQLLKLNLWGNRCDLSLSSGAESNSEGNPMELLSSFDDDLLVNDSNFVWEVLNQSRETKSPVIIDIVLDNAGYELFTDLCLAAFVSVHGLADKIRFHGKRIPWFVSDVNLHDYHWLIESMSNSSDDGLKMFGELCKEHLKNGKWTIEIDSFWTEPYDFSHMKKDSPALYDRLAEAVLVVFKGDLNYRKLMGDMNWDYTKSLREVLFETNFTPTNVVALRTLKADVCVGLDCEKITKIEETNKDWMTTGQYGVIQASGELSL